MVDATVTWFGVTRVLYRTHTTRPASGRSRYVLIGSSETDDLIDLSYWSIGIRLDGGNNNTLSEFKIGWRVYLYGRKIADINRFDLDPQVNHFLERHFIVLRSSVSLFHPSSQYLE